MIKKGLFVTFEGLDGCGKTTQINQLKERLIESGHQVLLTRNPGGTDLGLKLREIVLHYPDDLSSVSELLLYVADRAQHMKQVILPALESGQVVLCDRHIDSTVAYQGYGRGLDIPFIHQLNTVATDGIKPDKTFFLDGDPEILSQRVHTRGQADRLEREVAAFKERSREGFLTLVSEEPERFVILDAIKPADDISEDIWGVIQPLL